MTGDRPLNQRTGMSRGEHMGMSQRGVEVVLGKLATDAALRRQFKQSPRQALQKFIADGIELTRVECASLESLDWAALERFAKTVDPRIQKACARTSTER